MKVAMAYILAFFLSPTIASVVRLATLLVGRPISVAGRFSISIIEGAVALGVSAAIFHLFGYRLPPSMAVVLIIACFINDLRRVRKGPPEVASYRLADLLGDAVGITGAAFVLLG